jgi:anthranilate phosphoribosyltransferase
VDDAAASAAVIRGVLGGEDGPARRIVLANAAAALLAAEAVPDLREGVRRAADAIDGGRALDTLRAMTRITAA